MHELTIAPLVPDGGAALLAGGFFLLWIALAVGGFLFWLWMLIDCLTMEEDEDNERILWTLVILIANFLGALIYFFVRKGKGRRVSSPRTRSHSRS